MCAICGCSDHEGFTVTHPEHSHDNAHTHEHEHEHEHEHHEHAHAQWHPHEHSHSHSHEHSDGQPHSHGVTISLEQAVMAKNDRAAQSNRLWLEERGIFALNLVSAPGAGKTTLLERTLNDLAQDLSITVVEGDQETQLDAQRIQATGCRAVQINTGAGCHLDSEMVAKGLQALRPALNSIVMIENVGNLVCPALFDLGENARVALLSVTEGEDKPLKYPQMFRSSQLMLLNKIDLLPHIRFSVDQCIEYARRVNPALLVMQVSATTGAGMAAWYQWLRQHAMVARLAPTAGGRGLGQVSG